MRWGVAGDPPHHRVIKMDKRNTFIKLKEMLEKVEGNKINLDGLRVLIIENVGGNERTIQSCLRIMGETGLIKDLDNCKFEIVKNDK